VNSNVIKVRTISNVTAVSRIKKESHEASLEAKDILARAQQEAAEMLREAESRKETVFAESAERGYAAGLDKWSDILGDAWQQRERFLVGHEPSLVALAIAIARKVIGYCVESDSAVVLHAAKQALRLVRNERRVTLKVNPADEAIVRDQAASLKVLGHEVGDLIIVANSAVEAGGCVVESDLGIIDGQLGTQLESIEMALLRRFDVSGP
jgi:type III secretion system HrpE/YscL family protein